MEKNDNVAKRKGVTGMTAMIDIKWREIELVKWKIKFKKSLLSFIVFMQLFYCLSFGEGHF